MTSNDWDQAFDNCHGQKAATATFAFCKDMGCLIGVLCSIEFELPEL